jgi:hypothetical protein
MRTGEPELICVGAQIIPQIVGHFKRDHFP